MLTLGCHVFVHSFHILFKNIIQEIYSFYFIFFSKDFPKTTTQTNAVGEAYNQSKITS